MAEEMKERSMMDPAYTWDLTGMYADEAVFMDDMARLDAMTEETAAFAGTLGDAAHIKAFFDSETELLRKLDNLFVYAQLRKSEDLRAEDAKRMFTRVYAKYASVMQKIAFAEPEILSLPEEELRQIADDPLLSGHRFTISKLIRRKAHTLSAPEETLLAGLAEVFAVPSEVSENLMDADLVFPDVEDGNGKKHPLSVANYILLQNSPDRTLRKNAFDAFYAVYKAHINTLAAAYSGAVKTAAAVSAARHYESSRAMAMAEEIVPEDVYDSLIASVHQCMPAMHRYVRLRKKMLGLEELHYYDLYTPLVQENTKQYSYEEAEKLVLMCVAPLGEEYVRIVRKAFRERWIDVYPNRGKTNGAFSSGSYDSAPYILTNFSGTLESVFTIAHEMGHSLHTWLANHAQPPQYAQYTLFVAEVASTVNENLLSAMLLDGATSKEEKLAYLNQCMEGFKGTVYRQTMFAEFEKEAHAMAQRGEALTPQSLGDLYERLIREYFGPELVVDDAVRCEWARIPHFYRPFYVYKYATSYCAATAISEAVLKDGPKAVGAYLSFLSMGGSACPLDELRSAGVDLSTPEPFVRALTKFDRILEEAESML